MIKSVELENWRSIKSLTIPIAPLTALVGPNGAGKSAVLAAIDFALGSRWPGMAYLDIPRDFHCMDTTQPLRIRCHFDPGLILQDAMKKEHAVGSIEYSSKPYKIRVGEAEAGDLHDEYLPLSEDGEQLLIATRAPRKGAKPEFAPLVHVTKGLREQARVLTIGDRRTVSAHASGRRGSVLNTLMSRVRKDFEKDSSGVRTAFMQSYEQALATLRTDAVQTIEAAIGDTAKHMLGFLGKSAVGDLGISFGFGDPADPFGSLTVMCTEGDLVLPAEMMGLGIQSAIVVGVFEALRQQHAKIGTVLIEEPEMYLHPQAQRFFHRILVDLVDRDQCQVIYSTHSPIFADMASFESIRLLHKPAGEATCASWVHKDTDLSYLNDQLKRQKLSQYMDPSTSEALFAQKVLLVEGHGDYLAAKAVADRLNVDLDAEGLSVVSCGGKNAIPFFARTCVALGIPVLAMHDEDVYASGGQSLATWQLEENATAPARNEAILSAAGGSENVFLLRPSLESELGIGRAASDKPMKVIDALSSMKLEQMPVGLVAAVRALTGVEETVNSRG